MIAKTLASLSLLFLMLAVVVFASALAGRPAQAQARFGDSTWVAPGAPSEGDPAADGPRVAEPERERTWETVLRTPFRIAFFPLRLVARGMEAGADIVERFVPSGRRRPNADGGGLSIAPAVSYSGAASLGLGATVSMKPFAGPGSRLSATGTWSLRDNRRLRLRALVGEDASVGAGLEAMHDYRPNRRFYGVGNDAPGDRTIYLRRDNSADAWISLGSRPLRNVRAVVGVDDIRIDDGYGGSDPRAADVFDPAQVPFLTQGSSVWSYGLAGDLAALDRDRDPSLGLHARADVRRAQSTGGADVDYDAWRIEGRGYLPVFASRRVVALRAAFQGVDPRDDSEPIPFYRLPESSGDNRFPAYSSGRFRDRRLLLAHAEYRWAIWERVSAVLLAQRGVVAPTNGALRYDRMHESYGGGLRYQISEESTARLEIANGPEGMNVYLDLKGDF